MMGLFLSEIKYPKIVGTLFIKQKLIASCSRFSVDVLCIIIAQGTPKLTEYLKKREKNLTKQTINIPM